MFFFYEILAITFLLFSPIIFAVRIIIGKEDFNRFLEKFCIYKKYNNIGVAVGTPQGLVVPVIKDAQNKSLAEIEKAISDMGLRAREGKIGMDELSGGTFTISNGGVYGSLMSTPILNPPQSGVLGMHNIVERPVNVNRKIKIKPIMYLALSYDHRIIDGKESVTFLKTLKENLEDPRRLFLNI